MQTKESKNTKEGEDKETMFTRFVKNVPAGINGSELEPNNTQTLGKIGG